MDSKAGTVAGAVRLLVGAALCLAPSALLGLSGREEVRGSSVLLLRTIGIRDVVLGAGTIAAASSESAGDVRRWLYTGLAGDSLDAAAALASRRSIGTPEAVLASAAALGFVALDRWALRATGTAPPSA